MSNLVVDNEILKHEWDYKKNEDVDINKVTLGSNKKYGGNATKDTNGKLLYLVVQFIKLDVLIVQIKKYWPDIMI